MKLSPTWVNSWRWLITYRSHDHRGIKFVDIDVKSLNRWCKGCNVYCPGVDYTRSIQGDIKFVIKSFNTKYFALIFAFKINGYDKYILVCWPFRWIWLYIKKSTSVKNVNGSRYDIIVNWTPKMNDPYLFKCYWMKSNKKCIVGSIRECGHCWIASNIKWLSTWVFRVGEASKEIKICSSTWSKSLNDESLRLN